jgi:hypothetical protein
MEGTTMATKQNVTVGNWTGDIEVAANYMDDDLRERLHNQMAPCAPQEFVDAYAKAHRATFDEEWVIN